MSYHIIKKTVFIILLALFQKEAQAQQLLPVKKITVEYHDSTWYKNQKELWQKEISKNKKNESSWLNYFMASRYYYATTNTSWKISNEKMTLLLNEMNKAIPKSFTYNLCKGWHMGVWDKDGFPYILEAYRLNPQHPFVLDELIVRYEVYGPEEKRKEICKKYFRTNDASYGLLNYNYNVLASLEKNAILFTTGDNDSYPIWILQDEFGFRTDVLLLNINLAAIDSYREMKLKNAGINLPKAIQDSIKVYEDETPERRTFMEKNIVRILSENSDRPVYVGLTCGGEDFMKSIKDKLYLVGLASKYSNERIDNIAFLKRNYEQNFLLDYLKIDLQIDERAAIVKWCNQNYVTPFVSLYKHYTTAGDMQKAQQIKAQIEKIAKESSREKEILDLIKE